MVLSSDISPERRKCVLLTQPISACGMHVFDNQTVTMGSLNEG